jgi:large subunit ribosomal protein L25
MAEQINVQQRITTGKRNNRRMRDQGLIPAILYGHGEQNVCLAVPADQVALALRRGSRVVELTGGANESALIRAMQWDTYGIKVLHVDFARVSADERVEVSVPIEIRGHAVGVKDGGHIEQLVREVRIECQAGAIPDKLQINVNALKIGDSITAEGLALPPGVKLLSHTDDVFVHCIVPTAAEEAETPLPTAAEPELIGRKPTDEEAGEE